MAKQFDVAVIGAGAAGMMCAAVAAQQGKRVVLIDHAAKLAEKIRISGGGRCNFTNINATPQNFLSENPHFCKSALSRYTPQDFLALVKKYRIGYHEKHKGQQFCNESAEQIIDMLKDECAAGGVHWRMPCKIDNVAQQADGGFVLQTDGGDIETASIVIATGGLSIPKIGASDLGYRLARQFGLPLVAQRPGLVPLTFSGDAWAPYAQLAGLALPVEISTGVKKERMAFHEDLLFTHRGLSGPAVLQISSYWQPGQPLSIDLAPGVDLPAALLDAKARSRKLIANELAALVPSRLADAWAAQEAQWQRPINEASDKALHLLAERLARWQLVPTGTEGYKKAEVTLGGVDTRALSQQTMEAKAQPGLYCIGEVVDITGWLGGYNFQWAWASAHACAQALPKGPHTL